MADESKNTADAVVVGGGVMGCSILYSLGTLGLTDTLLLERETLGSGSTGKSQGILRMHYSNEVTTKLAHQSLRIFKDFDEIVGSPSGYVRTGYLLIGSSDQRDAMERNLRLQRKIGVETKLISSEEVPETINIDHDEICAYESESGYADPNSVTQGYANAARKLGAQVLTRESVVSITVKADKVTGVVTDQGTISAPVVIVAAGPWSRSLLGTAGVEAPLNTVRHQIITLRRPEDKLVNHVAVGDIPNSLSARPDIGNLTYIGVGEEEEVSPARLNHGVDMDVVRDVSVKLASRMPMMEEATFCGGWSGLFTTTPDWHPILSRTGEVDGLYCAVGFSGHGFKLAPMVGEVMAELVTGGVSKSTDISMLGLDRFKEGKLMRSSYGMSVLA